MFRFIKALSTRTDAHEALERAHKLLRECDVMLSKIGHFQSRGLQIRINHELASSAWVDTKPEAAS